ncbi:MAG: helix-turn-helix transcriptional regulator [Vicingus serpentipes]|nr:helix-turn-helix transcriptional regulator [Vicingus serpentipes]
MNSIASLLNNVGKNITQLRKAHKLTQQSMANNVGVSVSQYQRIEAGAANVSFETLIKIAAYFNTGIDLLVYGEEVSFENEHIVIKEPNLAEKMMEIEQMSSADQKLAKQMIDLLIAKKELDKLVDKMH